MYYLNWWSCDLICKKHSNFWVGIAFYFHCVNLKSKKVLKFHQPLEVYLAEFDITTKDNDWWVNKTSLFQIQFLQFIGSRKQNFSFLSLTLIIQRVLKNVLKTSMISVQELRYFGRQFWGWPWSLYSLPQQRLH